MFTLLAGTTNQHKIQEINQLMSGLKLKLLSLSDYPDFPDVLEDGLTFEDNALKKAKQYYEYFKIPVFADDSGLVVPALNNEPGVLSARYAGPDATYARNNELLIQKIRKIPPSERIGKFVCTICYMDDHHTEFFTGTTEGTILTELTGKEGFGYDPLFYVPNLDKTYAQLSMSEKNSISHRGKAIIAFRNYLVGQNLVLTS